MALPFIQMHPSIHESASTTLSFTSTIVPDPAHMFLTSSFSRLSIAKPPKSTTIRMGGGPRTYPGGVSKWQWKRMQAKKAKQLLRARLTRQRQIYEMRKRAELSAAVAELERPWEVVETAPKLFSVSADEQLKVLADRFQKPGGFDLWSEKDGPQLFETVDGIPSARFFPKGVVHSIKPYGRITDGHSDMVKTDLHDEDSTKIQRNSTGMIGYEFPDEKSDLDSGLVQRTGHDEDSRDVNGKFKKKDRRRRIHMALDSGQEGLHQRDKESNVRKENNNKRNGRKQQSGKNFKVVDMSLQDDGSYEISKEEMEVSKMRRRKQNDIF